MYDTGLVSCAVLPFWAVLEVSRPEGFSQRRLTRWIDGMIRDASTSYLHGHPLVPGPTTARAAPLRVVEETVAGLPDQRGRDRPLPHEPCEARYYPGGIHGFQALVRDPAARRCSRDALAFLDRRRREP